MRPLACFTCRSTLAHVELPYLDMIAKVESDKSLMNNPEKKQEYITKELNKFVENDCCRMRLITSCDLVHIIR